MNPAGKIEAESGGRQERIKIFKNMLLQRCPEIPCSTALLYSMLRLSDDGFKTMMSDGVFVGWVNVKRCRFLELASDIHLRICEYIMPEMFPVPRPLRGAPKPTVDLGSITNVEYMASKICGIGMSRFSTVMILNMIMTRCSIVSSLRREYWGWPSFYKNLSRYSADDNILLCCVRLIDSKSIDLLYSKIWLKMAQWLNTIMADREFHVSSETAVAIDENGFIGAKIPFTFSTQLNPENPCGVAYWNEDDEFTARSELPKGTAEYFLYKLVHEFMGKPRSFSRPNSIEHVCSNILKNPTFLAFEYSFPAEMRLAAELSSVAVDICGMNIYRNMNALDPILQSNDRNVKNTYGLSDLDLWSDYDLDISVIHDRHMVALARCLVAKPDSEKRPDLARRVNLVSMDTYYTKLRSVTHIPELGDNLYDMLCAGDQWRNLVLSGESVVGSMLSGLRDVSASGSIIDVYFYGSFDEQSDARLRMIRLLRKGNVSVGVRGETRIRFDISGVTVRLVMTDYVSAIEMVSMFEFSCDQVYEAGSTDEDSDAVGGVYGTPAFFSFLKFGISTLYRFGGNAIATLQRATDLIERGFYVCMLVDLSDIPTKLGLVNAAITAVSAVTIPDDTESMMAKTVAGHPDPDIEIDTVALVKIVGYCRFLIRWIPTKTARLDVPSVITKWITSKQEFYWPGFNNKFERYPPQSHIFEMYGIIDGGDSLMFEEPIRAENAIDEFAMPGDDESLDSEQDLYWMAKLCVTIPNRMYHTAHSYIKLELIHVASHDKVKEMIGDSDD